MPRKEKTSTVNERKWRVTSLVVILLLVVGGFLLAFPPQEKINQGLDIQGGLSVVLSAESTDGNPVTREDMEKSKAIIEERVNALGASEASVQIQGDNQILVQIPGLSDSEEALATIGKTGVLEFARLDSFTDKEIQEQIDAGNIYVKKEGSIDPYVSENGTTYDLTDTQYDNISVDPKIYTPLFTGDHIQNVTTGKASDVSVDYAVNVTLDSEAAAAFAEASRDLLPTHGKIVIIIDGKVNSAPAIQSEILDGRVQITGGYTLEEAKSLQTVLNSGSLPVSFHYEQSITVGPTLGQGELQAGVFAMLLGLLLVMIYLLVFYKGFGLLTAANMLVYACVYLGVLAGLSLMGLFSLSLAGIAGIILSIGMAADSSILVVERFKEELKEGRSMKAASISGVKHAITTSIDADIVSIISALSLFFLASSSVKGFGLTLALGILCDIVVMLMFKAPLVRLLAPVIMKKHPGFWGMKYSLLLGDVRTGGHNYRDSEKKAERNTKRQEKDKDSETTTLKEDETKEVQPYEDVSALKSETTEKNIGKEDIEETQQSEKAEHNVKEHTSEEIAEILSNEVMSEIGAIENDEQAAVDDTLLEKPKATDGSAEQEDLEQEEVYLNRAQRRALNKINKKNKKKRK